MICTLSERSQAVETTGYTQVDRGLSLCHRDVQCGLHSVGTHFCNSSEQCPAVRPWGGLGILSFL